MDNCEGCLVYDRDKKIQTCVVIKARYKKICPCPLCLIKVICRTSTDVCDEYENLLRKSYNKIEVSRYFNGQYNAK